MGLFRSSTTRTSSTSPNKNNNLENEAPAGSTRNHIFSKGDHLSSSKKKLDLAIASEHAADQALLKSRAAVKEAKLEIAMLEKEAKLEAKAAQAKVASASKLRSGANRLKN